MIKINEVRFWVLSFGGTPDITEAFTAVLNNDPVVICDYIRQYPSLEKPEEVRAICPVIFRVDEEFYYAQEDDTLVTYGQVG